MSTRPWPSCRRVWLSSIASMSSWVLPSMRTRVPATETSLRALGSVQIASPVVSGVLTTAGLQPLCSSSWKETVPSMKARRPDAARRVILASAPAGAGDTRGRASDTGQNAYHGRASKHFAHILTSC